MTARIAIVTFPGSNGDHDAQWAMGENLGVDAVMVDYRATDLNGFDAVIIPGGFSYGDHLRAGAIARFSSVMTPLRAFAAAGGPVLGICNGFQILTEAHLLPGALLRNRTLQFHCHWTTIEIEHTGTAWTNACVPGQHLTLPVAHGDGAYFADETTLARLEANGQVVARYTTPGHKKHASPGTIVSRQENPNGSVHRIAAVANEQGNVVGLMPHPERAADPLVNGDDGLFILRSGLIAAGAAV